MHVFGWVAHLHRLRVCPVHPLSLLLVSIVKRLSFFCMVCEDPQTAHREPLAFDLKAMERMVEHFREAHPGLDVDAIPSDELVTISEERLFLTRKGQYLTEAELLRAAEVAREQGAPMVQIRNGKAEVVYGDGKMKGLRPRLVIYDEASGVDDASGD